DYFQLQPNGSRMQADASQGGILEELAEQADKRTKAFLRSLTRQERADVEERLAAMPPADRLEMATVLAHDPDAGRTGDVSLLDADQARIEAPSSDCMD